MYVFIDSTVKPVGSGADQRKHQSPVSLAFVRGIHQWPVNSTHKRPVTRKMFLFDDVIMRFWLETYDSDDVLTMQSYKYASVNV